MSLQARFSAGDSRLYSVNRDVAHNFGAVMMELATRVEEGRWDVLNKYLQVNKVSEEELGRACQCLCRFVVAQSDEKNETMAACLARCGYLDCSKPTQLALMAYLGTIVLGIHWAGVKEATLGGVGPTLDYQHLRWHGRRCSILMTMSKWKRRWYVFRRRVKLAWRVFTGRREYGDRVSPGA